MSMFNTTVSQRLIHLLSSFPTVFLSYDEPNADKHWGMLEQQLAGNLVARVHGVKGFDTAHKAAAAKFPNSSHVITVDADNVVDLNFYNVQLHADLSNRTSYSWNGRQCTNGLMYGNGGLKLWSRTHLENMRSHENSDSKRDAVDFCWDATQYKTLPGCWSTVYSNGSPYQAFRVGFREGVKLSMDQGEVIPFDRWPNRIHAANYQRLLTWMTVGADVDNGQWSMYGARLAVKMLQYNNFNAVNIRDYDWFNEFFKEHANDDPEKLNKQLGKKISSGLGFTLPEFNAEQSTFIKRIQLHADKELTNEDVAWQTNLKMFGWFNG